MTYWCLTGRRHLGNGLVKVKKKHSCVWILGWWWLCHLVPRGDESIERSDKNRGGKKARECETDDRSCPLSERRSPGVNIAFPCLPQLQACSLVHLLQRVKMEDRDTPVGRWEYLPPSQGCETWTHTHTNTRTHGHCCRISHASAVKVILICVCVLQGAKNHFVWCHLKILFIWKTTERFAYEIEILQFTL